MTEINLESFDFNDFVKDVLIFIDKDICNGCGLCYGSILGIYAVVAHFSWKC